MRTVIHSEGTSRSSRYCQSTAWSPRPSNAIYRIAHHKRLATVIEKTGRFLDPVIVVTAPKEGFWTPNGRHRLEAMRRLGARAITALVVPNREIAWQILALNTEKAHNLKERALEVIRIYRVSAQAKFRVDVDSCALLEKSLGG